VTPLLLAGAVLGLSSAAAPGPFQAYVLAQSIRAGAGRTLPVTLVPLVSDPPVIATVLLALSQVPAGLLRALQIGGGAIVLWLAASTLRAALRPPPAGAPTPPRGFLRAVLLNLTNPNAWLFWSAVGGPTLASGWRSAPRLGLAFLAGFYACLVLGNAVLVLGAGGLARLGPGFSRALGALSGALMAGFGVWQIGRGALGA